MEQQQKHLYAEGKHNAYAPSPEPETYARPLPYQPIASPTRFGAEPNSMAADDESEIGAADPLLAGGFSPTGFGAPGFESEHRHHSTYARPPPPVYYARHGGATPLYQQSLNQEQDTTQ